MTHSARLELPQVNGICLAFNLLLRRAGELIPEDEYMRLLDELDALFNEYRETQ